MEQLMWIGIWIAALVGLLISIPVLVIGGWFLFVTLIMGLGDKTIDLIDQGWKTIRRRIQTRKKPTLRVAQQNALQPKDLASVSVSPQGSP